LTQLSDIFVNIKRHSYACFAASLFCRRSWL